MSKRFLIIIAILSLLSAQLVGYYDTHQAAKYPVQADSSSNAAYLPQFGRNAEWDSPAGSKPNGLTDAQIQKIVANNSYEIIPKFADDFNIQKHFADTRRIVAAGNAIGNHIKVFEYFNGAFWFAKNNDGWQPYSSSFHGDPNDYTSWFAQDATSTPQTPKPIEFSGIGNAGSDSGSFGYVLDLTNPAYRQWAVDTVVAWMKIAPYKGVTLDSSNVIIGSSIRGSVADGKTTWNDLFCGPGTWDQTGADCPKVTAWNSGLTSLIAQMSAALHPLGDEVSYNGIGPDTKLRGTSRNLGLLSQADIATNENFCIAPGVLDPNRLTFESFTDDAAIMRSQAAAGKKIFQITNFALDAKIQQYASYCFAGFMIGWQPGYDYWISHKNYSDPLASNYPYLSEQNMNLGNPLTSDYTTSGSILSRSFQNGFVAVNVSDATASVRLPSQSLVQFSDGKTGTAFGANGSLTIPARSGALFLNDSYLHPPSTPGSTGTGSTGTGTGSTPTTAQPMAAKTTQNVDKALSGNLEFNVPANGLYTKVEYYIDGKLLHSATKFPDNWKLDTHALSNGTHTLTIKYYKKDGGVTVTTKQIVVNNPKSLAAKVTAVVVRAAPPAFGTAALLLLIGFLIHHYRLTHRSWLHLSKSSTLGALVVSDEHPAAIKAPPIEPGIVVKPGNEPPNADSPHDSNPPNPFHKL